MFWFADALAAPTTQDLAVWSSVNLQADLAPERDTGPRLWTDLHFRRMDSNFLGIARPAVGWDLAKSTSVFVGYAWIPSVGDATDGALVNEHRLWEQALVQARSGGVQLGFRPRLEQRFVAGEAGVGHRLRLWGRAGIPLTDKVGLSVIDEVFVGFVETTWTIGSNVAGFDQNRAFVGPALPIDGVGRVEFGYLNVFLLRESGNTMLHAASANLFASF